MRKTFMYLGQHGRLGNQLWQIASTLGEARRAGVEPAFPYWRYAKYFNVPMEYFGLNSQTGDEDFGRVHMQELRYFDGVEDEINSWFQPRPEVAEPLRNKYEDFQHRTCAVHIRRGDAIGREQWHPICPVEYYTKAMTIVREEESSTRFLVFSDGIEWCKENLPQGKYTFVSPSYIEHTDTIENDVDHEELILMMMCDRHIISNSTFSWWAAYLSMDASPIYPSIWFGPSYPELQKNFKEYFIPKTWTEVPS